MAAHLDLIHLRRHALPVHFIPTAARSASTRALPGPLLVSDTLSRLVATWKLGAGGRPVCAWVVETDDPPLPA